MKSRRRLWLPIALAAALLASGPALAQRHGPRVHFGFAFGGPLFYPGPYYYPYYPYYPPPYYYPPAVVVPPAPQNYIERGEAAADDAQSYWYYCAGSKAYYPYVKQCPGGWQRVTPQPPPG